MVICSKVICTVRRAREKGGWTTGVWAEREHGGKNESRRGPGDTSLVQDYRSGSRGFCCGAKGPHGGGQQDFTTSCPLLPFPPSPTGIPGPHLPAWVHSGGIDLAAGPQTYLPSLPSTSTSAALERSLCCLQESLARQMWKKWSLPGLLGRGRGEPGP